MQQKGALTRTQVRQGGLSIRAPLYLRRVRRTTTFVTNAAKSLPSTSAPAPHSGYHFDGSPRRFFEGWYFKVFIPEERQSFAVIFSIEDPLNNSHNSGVGIQVMGPNDGYICQYSKNVSSWWADAHRLALGAPLKLTSAAGGKLPRGMLAEGDFQRLVEHGFQASATQHQGSIVCQEAGASGIPMSSTESCSWSFTTTTKVAWGGSDNRQRATAGWLSVLSVFEPHWQVMMADGRANGWLQWGERRYEFTDAPCYAEKNWGGGFPSKWHWIQCNHFDGVSGLSVTAVGARRQLVLGVPGIEENVGMIGIHTPEGDFIELVPWRGPVEWDVDPWGRWWLKASDDKYEAVIEASCSSAAGTTLRAPTANQGLAPFCRDTFAGRCRLRVWRKIGGSLAGGPIIDASTDTAALEVGGGPWWSAWSAKADMAEPLKALLQLPIDVAAIGGMLPGPLKPPGL